MMIGIIGGGISGLAAAYFLERDYEILERDSQCGGLCTTYEKNGFLYDIGGHIMFSTNKEILDFEVSLLEDNIQKRRRSNKIWYKGRFVKYPFENGLHALDKEEIFECLRDYLQNNNPKPNNLKEWFYYTFGNSLANKYLIPYNEKIWKTDPASMSLEWVERIPKPPTEDVIKSAIGIETEGYTHQLYFYYPIKGGFQSLIKAFEKKLTNIETNKEVKAIYKESNKWKVETQNSTHSYQTLISTMPIFELVKILKENIPSNVTSAINQLRYNSMAVVLVGLNKVKHADLTAIYVPDKESPAHRYCFSAGFAENLSPKGCSSIFAEITFPSNTPKEEIASTKVIDKTVGWLIKEGFIEKSDVCETDIKYIKYAYPVYDLSYTKNMKIINEYFDNLGINLLGRFAQFVYINSDICVHNAQTLVKKIKSLSKNSV